MANFLDKLKKGMKMKDIKSEEESVEEVETEDAGEPEEEKPSIPAVPLGPKELSEKELEEKIGEEEEAGIIKTAGIKNTVLSNIKEKSAPAPKPKKIKSKPKPIAVFEKSEDWLEPEGQLVIDVYETDNEIVIQSAIAGITPENLDISIEKDMVSIRGKRECSSEKKGKNYLIEECYWGAFSREIILPSEVDSSKAEASMKNGILTIKAPKIERERKTIAIK